jgi:hypothetical protein
MFLIDTATDRHQTTTATIVTTDTSRPYIYLSRRCYGPLDVDYIHSSNIYIYIYRVSLRVCVDGNMVVHAKSPAAVLASSATIARRGAIYAFGSVAMSIFEYVLVGLPACAIAMVRS